MLSRTVPENHGVDALETFDARAWAEEEFGGAELGDVRREARLIDLATALAQASFGTLPRSLPRPASLKATYRLLTREEMTHAAVIASHLENTRESCSTPGEVLLIEDTTELDFTDHHALEMGWSSHPDDKGVNVHSTLAIRVREWDSDGEPAVDLVGVFGQQCWSRQGEPKTRGETKAERLARSRESARWASVLGETAGPPDGVRWTLVCDREGDIYEVFEICQNEHCDFLIRAREPRALMGAEGSLFDVVADAALLGTISFPLRARPGVRARTAILEVRSSKVTIRGPYRIGGRLEPKTFQVVEAREIGTPKGVEPIHWILLTTWDCSTFDLAKRVVKSYAKRWLIEEYHKALKTGVGAEKTQLSTSRRILALFGVLAVVAARLVQLKLLATTSPNDQVAPDTLTPEALAVIEADHPVPKGGWTNRTLLIAIARLGGFLGRRSDGDPGWLTLWRGWQRLMDLVQGYELAMHEKRQRSG